MDGEAVPALVSHFWGLGVLAAVVNIGIARVRMRAIIAKGAITEAQANRFCVRAAVVLAVVGTVFELVTWVTSVPAPCQFSLPLSDPRLLPSYAVTVLLGAALLYWVWKRGGDQMLALVAPAFSRGGMSQKVYTPREIRLG